MKPEGLSKSQAVCTAIIKEFERKELPMGDIHDAVVLLFTSWVYTNKIPVEMAVGIVREYYEMREAE